MLTDGTQPNQKTNKQTRIEVLLGLEQPQDKKITYSGQIREALLAETKVPLKVCQGFHGMITFLYCGMMNVNTDARYRQQSVKHNNAHSAILHHKI